MEKPFHYVKVCQVQYCRRKTFTYITNLLSYHPKQPMMWIRIALCFQHCQSYFSKQKNTKGNKLFDKLSKDEFGGGIERLKLET